MAFSPYPLEKTSVGFDLRNFYENTTPAAFALLFQQACVRAKADEMDILQAIEAELRLRKP